MGKAGGKIISTQLASALAPPPSAPRWSQRVTHLLWSGRSVRAQLLLVFVLIDLAAVLIAGGVGILRVRMQSRIETAASMRLAELLVGDALNFVHQPLSAEQFLAALPGQLRALRHVRIVVKDAVGAPVAATLPAGTAGEAGGRRANERVSAPAWFVALVASPIDTHKIPVLIDHRSVGQVEIIGEPADEIAEFWENTVAIGTAAVLLNVLMIGILYVLFGRVLDPLSILASGLADLERKDYNVRLPQPHARELAAIADRFNALALTLETVSAENVRLNRRLITAQDDERRRTALELHDEVGPCLFGLKANAASMANQAALLPDSARQRITEQLHDTLGIIEHLQTINRSMLGRLRPMALGHVPLVEILRQLVSERARQHSEILFSFTAGELRRSYGDTIDLTIYRCVQESLTNIIRHAQAKQVSVNIDAVEDDARLAVTVRDDGCGMQPGRSTGFGIRGMQERVEGLGGRYVIEGEVGRGTCVRLTIPLIEPHDAEADTDGQRNAMS
jgi:two-component system, NarL family, sensor histidine kinase UhpB